MLKAAVPLKGFTSLQHAALKIYIYISGNSFMSRFNGPGHIMFWIFVMYDGGLEPLLGEIFRIILEKML